MSEQRFDRRHFLGAAAAASAGFALGPAIRSARAANEDANDRIRVGVMGTNGRGSSLAQSFGRAAGAEVAYVCDVDERAAKKAAEIVVGLQERAPQITGDFRRILDDDAVDVLVVAAPDHWHAPATILACAAGKHVYVEKPCCHSPREGELMVEAARKHSRVVQMGNQRRSYPFVMDAMEELRSGVIGRVYHSRSGYRNTRPSIGHGSRADVPEWLDFELWQGPAPRRPFQDNLLHYNWHWFWHWGTGELGNNGVHMIDLCRWGLGADYPERVVSGGGRFRYEDDQETPDTQVVTFEFPGGRSLVWEGLSCNSHHLEGTTFHGENGTLVLTDSGYTILDEKDKEVRKVDARGGDHYHIDDFLSCVRTGEHPHSEIEGGYKSTLLCHLGNIAQRTSRALRTDPKNGRIIDDSSAEKLWSREYEPGWEPKV